MAIQGRYRKARTGAVFPEAHYVLQPPVFRKAAKQGALTFFVYANKAEYDDGRAPEGEVTVPFEEADYTAIMTAVKNRVEQAVINRLLPGGTRVPD